MARREIPHFTLDVQRHDGLASEIEDWPFVRLVSRFGEPGAVLLMLGHTLRYGKGRQTQYRVNRVRMLPPQVEMAD